MKDTNKNSPEFLGLDSQGKYPAAVSDTTKTGDYIVTVVAIDEDGTSPNNKVSITTHLQFNKFFINVYKFFLNLSKDLNYVSTNNDVVQIFTSCQGDFFSKYVTSLCTCDICGFSHLILIVAIVSY